MPGTSPGMTTGRERSAGQTARAFLFRAGPCYNAPNERNGRTETPWKFWYATTMSIRR